MNIILISATLRNAKNGLRDKGYVSVDHTFYIDPDDDTFSMRITWRDELGNEYNARCAMYNEDGDLIKSYNLPLADYAALSADMFKRVNDAPRWETIKKECGLAKLAEAVNYVAEVDEAMFTTEQLEVLALIRTQMETLAGNALSAPSVEAEIEKDIPELDAAPEGMQPPLSS